MNTYFPSQKSLVTNKKKQCQRLEITISRQMTEIDHQKKLDVNTMNMYPKSVPRERNRRKPSSERNKKYLWKNNIAKTISNTQYMPDDIVINTTTSNIHNIILCTTASTIISNNINIKTDLPANNNKVIQTTPSTIRVSASYTTNFLSVTRNLQNLSQQIHSSQTKSYTLFRSKGYLSLKKKIKQSLKNYSNICTTKISAQIKSESQTNLLISKSGKLSHPIQNLDNIKTKKTRHQPPLSSNQSYLQYITKKRTPSMSTKSCSPREKITNTGKQYIDVN